MRKCCQCAREDHEIPTGEMDSRGEKVVHHFVVPEIRYIGSTEELTPRLMRLGWKHRPPFQGRNCIERYICRECLNENEVRDRVWKGLRSAARKLEKRATADEEYYALLCE